MDVPSIKYGVSVHRGKFEHKVYSDGPDWSNNQRVDFDCGHTVDCGHAEFRQKYDRPDGGFNIERSPPPKSAKQRSGRRFIEHLARSPLVHRSQPHAALLEEIDKNPTGPDNEEGAEAWIV